MRISIGISVVLVQKLKCSLDHIELHFHRQEREKKTKCSENQKIFIAIELKQIFQILVLRRKKKEEAFFPPYYY